MVADAKYDAVHEKTKVDETFRYGCNSVMKPKRTMWGYYAPARDWFKTSMAPGFKPSTVWVSFRMSKPCRNFYLWDTDPACAGCETPRDHEYADRMRGMR